MHTRGYHMHGLHVRSLHHNFYTALFIALYRYYASYYIFEEMHDCALFGVGTGHVTCVLHCISYGASQLNMIIINLLPHVYSGGEMH